MVKQPAAYYGLGQSAMASASAPQGERPTVTGASLVHAALTAAVESAVELLGAARVAVLIPEAGGLRSVARRGWDEHAVSTLATALSDGESAGHIDAGVAIASSATETPPAQLMDWLERNEERAFVACPLFGPGGAVGALALGFSPPARITTARLRSIELIATPLAIAITAAGRRESSNGASDQGQEAATAAPNQDGDFVAAYDRQMQFAAALAEVVRVAAESGQQSATADAAAVNLLRVMSGVDLIQGWVLDHEAGRIRRILIAGAHSGIDNDPAPVPLNAEVGAARALTEGRAVLWRGDPATWPKRLQEFAQREDLATIAHVPMNSAGRTIGVLTLGSRVARDYEPEELAFVAALAAQVGREFELTRDRAATQAERDQLTSMIETLPDGVIVLGADGTPTRFNQSAIELLGRLPVAGDVEAQWQAYRPRAADGTPISVEETPAARALAGETVRAVEMVVGRPDGSDVPLLMSAGPVPGSGDAPAGAVLTFQDITKVKELDRLKDNFINTVSHELRTPTTTIRGGALTLLRRGDHLDDDTRRQLLQDIADESERLHHLVEDLLSLSRSQAGMQMSPEPMRVHRLINKVVIDLGTRMGSHPLTIDAPASLPLIEADPLALEQVLRNLIQNAVRHSPRGGPVELEAAVGDNEVVIGVLDRGPGIPEADLDRVFEPFYRLPSSVASATQGAGLGLAVCRRLVMMNGGRIWVDRRSAGGSAFRFSIPVAADDEE
jgi:signal transduction histidine kinase